MTQPGQFQSAEYQTQPGENVIHYEPNGYAQQYSQTYYQPQGDDEARYAAEQEAQQPQQESQQNEKPKQDGEKKGGLNFDDLPDDEYGALVTFIRAQKRTGGDDDDEETDIRIVKKRSLWTPWKVREVRVNKNGEEEAVAQKVPQAWLETDVFQGVSESEVPNRRAMFGYN